MTKLLIYPLFLSFVLYLGLLSVSLAETSREDEPPIDWSKPVVSRGFGSASINEIQTPDQQQAYRSGQMAYFFGNHVEARRLWLPLAEAGHPDAQASLGWLYQAGLGGDVDYRQARHWYELAVIKGHAVAQNNLAVMYEQGLGVTSAAKKAYQLYLQSAQQGYRYAQYNTAIMLIEGRGTERDLQAAKQWLQKAAAQGVQAADDKLKQLDEK